MKLSREILKELLLDRSINKILIAENHMHQAAKNLLIQNMDLFVDESILNGRRVTLILEHISAHSSVTKRLESLASQIVKEINDEALDKILIQEFPVWYRKKLREVIKSALKSKVRVVGGENKLTNYSSIVHNLLDRIAQGNRSFAQEIKNNLRSANTDIIIFLGGMLHIENWDKCLAERNVSGVKELVVENNDTRSWFIEDCEHDQDEVTMYDQDVVHGTIKCRFDIVTKTKKLDTSDNSDPLSTEIFNQLLLKSPKIYFPTNDESAEFSIESAIKRLST